MADKSESDKSERWWEYYVVRYFAGTVVGGLILTQAGAKCSKLTLSGGTSGSLEALVKNFALLAALSFAYCYVASAPMLTLHTSRALFKKGMSSSIKSASFTVWITPCALLIFFAFLVLVHQSSAPIHWLFLSGFFVVGLFQTLLICIALSTKGNEIKQFYKELAEIRARKTSKIKEYVESYRHLREHANAYGIIVLEMALAPALVWNCEAKWISAVLVIWLIPPALCWIIATMLESNLVQSPEDFPKDEAKT